MTDFTAHAAVAAPAPPIGPGLVGFLVVAAIGVALYFLVKSMNRQISKIEVPREADLDKADMDAPDLGKPEEADDPQARQRPNGTR